MTNLGTCLNGLIELEEPPADVALLARWCATRDAVAMELLVRRHGQMVLGVCRRVLGNVADADDAFQATFLIFVEKAGTLTRPEQSAGWLHAVALRVSQRARAVRNRRREREAELVDAADPTEPGAASETADLRRALDAELDRLPEKYRLPIVLCELEGRTLDEAARLLGWPKGTVAGRLSRGRELLRKRLSRRGIGLPLFLIVPAPAIGSFLPSEPLVSATVAGATGTGTVGSAPSAELARAVMRDGFRRRLRLVVLLLLTAAAFAFFGWQAGAAGARSAQARAGSGGCPLHSSP
ncbi:RNA polymerase sigma factor [Frigoriglobus tundricola]|uniref:ECF RNA polymerase sigma factor SigE n=1 Tax=Frigoriglobus tundricola TaxID=2774151 RepID=A0A6M5YG22_9BACT|nr:sigma-70 family RNA polymerase sigma factor [Frigoriglobus tundricola]QJW92928.1 hypothetical protein FTUN_0425 [Frigoriglobus tundricola]